MARRYYEQSLAIFKKVLGDNHPHTATGLNNLGLLLHSQGDYAAALSHYERALAILKKVVGENHPDTAACLNNLGHSLQAQGQYGAALPHYERALAILRKVVGENHPDTAACLNSLGHSLQAQGQYGAALPHYERALAILKKVVGENHRETARCLNNLGHLLQAQGQYGAALPHYERALAIFKKVVGENHPETALVLDNLGVLLQSQGDYVAARSYHEQALAVRKKALGNNHPLTAFSLNNLGLLMLSQGDYAAARAYYEQALAIGKKVLGESHPQIATVLSNLGVWQQSQGDYAAARPYYEQALAIRKKTLGDNHPDTAQSLSTLGALLEIQGDYAAARPYYEQALAIRKKTLGDNHPDTAESLSTLGVLLESQGDYAIARRYHEQALAIRKKSLGDNHPDTSASLHSFGAFLQRQGDHAAALSHYERALAILKKVVGENHPGTALCLMSLFHSLQAQGQYGTARPYYEKALAICKKVLGDNHRNTAGVLNNLGGLLESQGDYAGARPCYEQALAISRRNLELAAAAQSERQQLLMEVSVRFQFDNLMSLPWDAAASAHAAYAQALAWKGTVFARQQRLRLERSAPELSSLVDDLRVISRKLAGLSFAAPEPKTHQQLQELSARKEKIERELTQKSRVFLQEQQLQKLTPEKLLSALSPDMALVDFLVYWQHRAHGANKGTLLFERRLNAFVLRSGAAIVRLDLGPMAPIGAAIERWRAVTKIRPSGREDHPGMELRRLVWQPLEKHLVGAKTVLVVPDDVLGRLPFAALPGRSPGSYLLEDMLVTVLPLPRMLPELRVENVASVKAIEPTLLLLGDVDFDAATGKSAANNRTAPRSERRGPAKTWRPLPGTRGEIVTIRDSFERRFAHGKVKILRGEQATEKALRDFGPKHSILHLATHGFFASPEVRSAFAVADNDRQRRDFVGDLFGKQGVAGFHPGLLSGLVLAGANRPPEQGQADGILTALEVAEMDLHQVDLAVLSACETGLGKVSMAAGEGILGLQRAFQVAGARSVIASLWTIDDDATRKLMERFYENLWHKKLSKQEALRQAQLAMLRGELRRGAEIEREQDSRLPPYYWAAFVLSGDWR
jgi:CHAT domain-containing protein/tetratricopeptide (TPR) repeat protein